MGDGYQEVQEVISIHAPTRGATSLKATEYKLSIDFNPRSHERSDNYIPDEFKSYIISIHAPTRGATSPMFIFSPPHLFQSTLPREERLLLSACFLALSNFNPRSHERSDFEAVLKDEFSIISIHAPTRGATSLCLNCGIKKEFQSTLPREERHSCYCLSCPVYSISIHAPTRGATSQN